MSAKNHISPRLSCLLYNLNSTSLYRVNESQVASVTLNHFELLRIPWVN